MDAQPSTVTIVIEEDLVPSDDAATSAQTSDGMERASGVPALSEPLIRAGEIVLASTIITTDSDTPGPGVAEIRKGPLRGARLLGGFEANQGNIHQIVRFATAVLADGTQIPVSAYAVDARQKSLAGRSDLDRCLFAG